MGLLFSRYRFIVAVASSTEECLSPCILFPRCFIVRFFSDISLPLPYL